MPRIFRPVLLLAVLAAALLGAGCTTTVTGAPGPQGAAPTTPGQTDAVAWVDQVCGAMLPFIRTAATPPELETASDPASLVEGLSSYFGQAGTAAGTAIDGMAAAGPAPVAGGDDLVTRLTGTLTTLKTSFDGAKTRLDAVDTSDPQSLATDLPGAIAPLQELANLPDPTADLTASPELESASKQAPNCQRIEKETG